MKIFLTKKNRKTTDVIFLEADEKLLRIKEGKLGKSLTYRIENHGTYKEAKEEIQRLIKEFENRGYKVDTTINSLEKTEIFDKAKWHLNSDFPEGLDSYQAYVHTGMFLAWLINNKLISTKFSEENKEGIRKFLRREKTGTQIYIDFLDGVFTSNELNDKAVKFTKYYFDFDNGSYIDDYDECFTSKLDSIFHAKDTWENFDKISSIIDVRFNEWLG